MTEAEWLSRSQLVAMLTHVNRSGCTERKLQLAAIAFCHHLGSLPFGAEWHDTVARFEDWVEGAASAEQVLAARQRLEEIADATGLRDEPGLLATVRGFGYRAATYLIATGPGRVPRIEPLLMVKSVAHSANVVFGSGQRRTVRAAHCQLVRDIFGNPFRPISIDPHWLTSNVIDLARTIYEEKAFERMPILADALMDAGCDHDDILNHCRSTGPHVRGCFVVDLILGKG